MSSRHNNRVTHTGTAALLLLHQHPTNSRQRRITGSSKRRRPGDDQDEVTDKQQTTKSREQANQQRREQRREEWRSFYAGEDDNNKDDDSSGSSGVGDDENSKVNLGKAFNSVFPTQRPRHVLEGLINAVKSVVMGTLIGVAAFLSVPIVAVQQQGWWPGLLVGGLAGSLVGAGMTLVGLGNGLYHVCVGTVKTPVYIQAVWLGKYWDTETETWVFYYLDKEIEELASSEQTHQSNVADMVLYDLLEVPCDATTKIIKKAYFAKAKILHPDKNPNDPAAGDQFRALHSAYQTLSDSDKRDTYDKYGMSEDASSTTGNGNSPLAMDAHVFFAVLFGSQAVEPYIGELSVASWTDQILKLAQAGFTPTTLTQMLDDDAGVVADQKRRKRQLDIALHLLSRMEGYTSGNDSKEVFRAGCRTEAALIVETTPFGDVFLRFIGSALKVQGSRYLGLHKSLLGWKAPFYIVNKKIRDVSASLTSLRKTIHVGWTVYSTLKPDSNTTTDDNNNNNKTSDNKTAPPPQQKTNEEMIEILLPGILDMAWAYNIQDIGATLQGACWRLLADANDNITKKDRIKRAQAIQMIGDEFMAMGKSSIKQKKKAESCKEDGDATGTKKTCTSTTDDDDDDEMDLLSRLEVAYGVAHLKASGQTVPEDSEALIQQRTSEALAKKRSDEAAARRKTKRKEERAARNNKQKQR
eukprot:CAMPEP_0119008788 /NCGR_PEP_ID=MMETSP1176-20130426/3934_1 /TAXON_ID=265551 /ORGANISM="Synedropsis recta cf, Strain CCMP1620" /LENGTH=694 /DNA_ID=CAMNT_0006961187 /DNA_START=297 /DNA_END=2382 /DNA_ORIENTATION=+